MRENFKHFHDDFCGGAAGAAVKQCEIWETGVAPPLGN